VRGLIDEVAEFAVRARDAGLPEDRRRQTAQRVLDVVGNCLAASREEIRGTVAAVVDAWGGREAASVIGGTRRYPASGAALVNGTLSHALDFDDTHLPSVLHPSLLDAVAVGNEICVRLGMAGYDEELGNSLFFERGQHATAICGAVGAGVAVAMVHGLDADGVASAAGIAASMGAGLLEANRTGGTVKRVHTGWAAHCAVAAAELAGHGLTGPPTVLEGRFGFFQAWCGDRARPERVVDGLGELWDSDDIHIKPYPCNHFTHAGVDAALALRRDGVRPGEVTALELGVPTAVLRTIAEPAEVKAAPPTGYAAAFSGPYTVAAALCGGGGLGVWLDDFTDAAAREEERRRLAALVRCVPDPRCDELFPHHLPAVLRARTAGGAEHEVRVDTNRGGPDRPLSDEEAATKFRLGAGRALPADVAAELGAAVLDLPTAGSVRPLLELARA